jgi:hypothetical protein
MHCPNCGFPIDRRNLPSLGPKCDEDLVRAKALKPLMIDLAHRGETVPQALSKLDAAVPPFAQGHDPDQIRDADKPGQAHFADNPRVGYWHDFGHGQIKHNLGLLDHVEWLEMILPHLVGCHVHDVQWPARDHRTPFSGVLDYSERCLQLVHGRQPGATVAGGGGERVIGLKLSKKIRKLFGLSETAPVFVPPRVVNVGQS